MAGGRSIVAYIDVASFYSYLAFLRLMRDRAALESHGVELEFVPVFLGGINHGSGNKPPWTLPAKANYSAFETERAKVYFKATHLGRPDPFPANSLLPMRSMAYIKARYGDKRFVDVFRVLCEAVWTDAVNTAEPDKLRGVLGRAFPANEADEIVQAGQSQQWKDQLKANTDEALGRGAFGAPWFWVRDARGREEPFFGSDRFHMMWEYLGLPWTDMAIQPKL